MIILKILGIITILVLMATIIKKLFIDKEEYFFSEDETVRFFEKSIKYFSLYTCILLLVCIISTFFNK